MKTTTIHDFEFNIHGYDFVADVKVSYNETLEVIDLDFEGKEMFDVQYIIKHLENELNELLWQAYNQGIENEEDARSEYRASIKI